MESVWLRSKRIDATFFKNHFRMSICNSIELIRDGEPQIFFVPCADFEQKL